MRLARYYEVTNRCAKCGFSHWPMQPCVDLGRTDVTQDAVESETIRRWETLRALAETVEVAAAKSQAMRRLDEALRNL